jgi:hypothetical protein
VGLRSREIDQGETDHRDRSHALAVKPQARAAQPNSLPRRDGTALTEAPSHSLRRPYWHARSAARYAFLACEHRADRLSPRKTGAAGAVVADRVAPPAVPIARAGHHAGPPHRADKPARTALPPPIETSRPRLDNAVPAHGSAPAPDAASEPLFRGGFSLQSPRLAARLEAASLRRPLSTRIYSGLSLVRENKFG